MGKNSKSNLLVLGFAVSQFGFLIAGGIWFGLWLDRRWDSSPWYGFLGLFVGIVSGIMILIKLVRSA